MKPSTLATMHPDKVTALIKDVYIFAYPLVLMDVTRRQTTNVPNAHTVPMRAPINQFAHFRTYPKADSRDVVRFNFDTLYSFAWVDLSTGPIILTVPDTGGRYYLVPTLDMWTDVFCSVGARTTGTKTGNYAYTAPGWTGTLPGDVTHIQAPTSMIWMMGRTQTNGPSDYDHVHKLQDGLRLTPLDRWGSQYSPPANSPVDASVDDNATPLLHVKSMGAANFFKYFADLLKKYRPHPNDYPILFRMQALGLAPGQDWDDRQLDNSTTALLDEAVNAALDDVTKNIKATGTHVNGWNYAVDNIGTYGTSYLRRATIALAGLGANLPEDAVYPVVFFDGQGEPLDGAKKYVLHFDKDKLPPADAFWSLTMYDALGFQVPNRLNRFAIGDRDKLKFNGDGSLDLYIQHDSPGQDRESNWLPSPASGQIGPTMRIYAPRQSILNGSWVPPPIKAVG